MTSSPETALLRKLHSILSKSKKAESKTEFITHVAVLCAWGYLAERDGADIPRPSNRRGIAAAFDALCNRYGAQASQFRSQANHLLEHNSKSCLNDLEQALAEHPVKDGRRLVHRLSNLHLPNRRSKPSDEKRVSWRALVSTCLQPSPGSGHCIAALDPLSLWPLALIDGPHRLVYQGRSSSVLSALDQALMLIRDIEYAPVDGEDSPTIPANSVCAHALALQEDVHQVLQRAWKLSRDNAVVLTRALNGNDNNAQALSRLLFQDNALDSIVQFRCNDPDSTSEEKDPLVLVKLAHHRDRQAVVVYVNGEQRWQEPHYPPPRVDSEFKDFWHAVDTCAQNPDTIVPGGWINGLDHSTIDQARYTLNVDHCAIGAVDVIKHKLSTQMVTQPLSDLATVISPQNLTADPFNEGDQFIKIAQSDINEYHLVDVQSTSTRLTVTEPVLKQAQKQRLYPHDLILVKDKHRFGQIGLVDERCADNWLADQTLWIIRVQKELDYRYLFFYLSSPMIQAYLKSIPQSKRVKEVIQDLPVIMPCDDAQHQQVIEQYQRVKAEYEKIKDSRRAIHALYDSTFYT